MCHHDRIRPKATPLIAAAQPYNLTPAWLCLLLAVPSALGLWTRAGEEAPAADKAQYHLFNPTPKHLLRDLSTDRPDKTESAYTVDAGRFQLEMDVANYTYDRHNTDRTDARAESLSIAPVNLKLGLRHNVDLQVIVESYTTVRIKERGVPKTERHRGFGDITIRSKANLWGNDGGPTALALMPFIKIPTNQDDLGNDSVEGGLIVPFAAELPFGWGMGLMTEVDFVRRETGGGYDPEFVNTITFARDIVGNLGGYVEFFSLVNPDSSSDWIGTVDFGFTYAITEDIQLDGGLNIGVTRSADDFNPFVGISWRF